MNTVDLTARALEALLMVAEEPLTTGLLAQLLERPTDEVEALCREMAAGYEVDGRGFVLVRVAGGWRYESHPDLAPYVERYVLDGQSARLSAAALETLAIVAYKQPISRAQVAAIRGVNVDGVMRTLEQRGYIAEVARDPGPGQAVLFGTTASFLEKLGLDSLDDLAPLAAFVPDAEAVEALEQGLRPSGGDTGATGTTGRDSEDGSGGEGARPATPEDAASAGTDAAGTGADESDSDGDALERLEETTARLDALVDEVRDRMASAEAAVAAHESDSEPDEPDADEGEAAPPAADDSRAEPG